jgi:hypothetical protein
MKRSASESARLARLQPITDDDLRQTREFLARHKTFPML